MPFLGQDWRSPGQSWVKTADGWKRFLDEKSGSFVSDLGSYCSKEVYNKENLFNSLNYDVAAKKRKKDMLNSKTKTQYFHQEKWIYVHKGSTKERHGYCTLGEAFNRLDFSTAILDSRRFNYVVRLLELIAKSQLTSLSGIAQKNFMNILEKVVLKVLEDQQNIRLIRELLQTLYTSLCTLVQRVGKSVLVGNINMWVYRMETILHWQQQLNNIQITRPAFKGLTFTDLPLCLQLNIMQRLSDGRDLVSLGQVAPDLHVLSEDRSYGRSSASTTSPSGRLVWPSGRSFLLSHSACHPAKLPWHLSQTHPGVLPSLTRKQSEEFLNNTCEISFM
uniref:F-box only protein 32 n=1 Tax=Bos mutus grunniens TaxID=30521 RepID=A0A8B9XPY6_BOSMU